MNTTATGRLKDAVREGLNGNPSIALFVDAPQEQRQRGSYGHQLATMTVNCQKTLTRFAGRRQSEGKPVGQENRFSRSGPGNPSRSQRCLHQIHWHPPGIVQAAEPGKRNGAKKFLFRKQPHEHLDVSWFAAILYPLPPHFAIQTGADLHLRFSVDSKPLHAPFEILVFRVVVFQLNTGMSDEGLTGSPF